MQPCKDGVRLGDVVGKACTDCGHINIVHRMTDQVCSACEAVQHALDLRTDPVFIERLAAAVIHRLKLAASR